MLRRILNRRRAGEPIEPAVAERPALEEPASPVKRRHWEPVRVLAAVPLLVSGVGGMAIGGSVYFESWQTSRAAAQSAEAESFVRSVDDAASRPIWLDSTPVPVESTTGTRCCVSSEEARAGAAERGASESLLAAPESSAGPDGSAQRVALAAASDIELGGAEFRFVDPPEPGARVHLLVELRNKSSLPSTPLSVAIAGGWFEGYQVLEAIPSVIEDRVGEDGSRYFEFPGLPAETSETVELHFTASNEDLSPPQIRVVHPDGTEIGQAQPRTVAPRPRPGPARALSIPRLGIQARVIQVPWEPPAFVVGQIDGSANVSEGNTVLVGHLNGPAGNVFARLDQLRPGDEVVAVSRGLEYRFVVSETSVLPGNDSGPITRTDTPRLTLMTCTGTFNPFTQDYSHRLWVVAEPPELARATIEANALRAAQATATAAAAARAAAAAEASAAATATAEAIPTATPLPQPVARPVESTAQPPRAGLLISGPASDALVSRRFVVNGSRAAPFDPGLHVWLLIRAHVEGSLWYPYPHEIVGRPDGSWEVELDLGGPPNIRHELRLGVVDNATHRRFLRHIAEHPGEPFAPGPVRPSTADGGRTYVDLPEGFRDEAVLTVIRK